MDQAVERFLNTARSIDVLPAQQLMHELVDAPISIAGQCLISVELVLGVNAPGAPLSLCACVTSRGIRVV